MSVFVRTGGVGIGRAIGGAPVDRVPFSVWRHFYPDEAEARSLADVTVAFTQQHKLDLIKFALQLKVRY